jgi:hypothetical protein
MNRKIRLLQIASLVFFLNTTMAYGGCCFVTPTTDGAPEMEMPCHQVDDSGGETSDSGNCLLCVPMLVSFNEKANSAIVDAIVVTTMTPALITNSIRPLFRPPITLLS